VLLPRLRRLLLLPLKRLLRLEAERLH